MTAVLMEPEAEVEIITEQGRKNLGKLLERSRLAHGWSLDQLVSEIRDKTGFKLSKSAISQLERGNTYPKWDTLAILSAAGYIVNSRTKMPLTTNHLFRIACEKEPSNI